MSFKAKDLYFDNTQPAFLRRMRAELAGDGSGRHEQPIPRNKRLKKDDDEDDAPTYVLEDTNQSMTRAEYEAMVAGKDGPAADDATEASEDVSKATASEQPKDNIVEVGKANKKRKVAKVIGEDKDDEVKAPNESEKKVVKKFKKKGKAVKLSFGDDDA
ncbi:hypothetical protein BU23DRAFT_580871 [Bimuria novae-zelandiae CBS 107.79]|uniref:DUF4604 domain-containing protein n=1 Tax=Bimuria novae-zelandiae CBS 107.79 TaxID=1447943 RepID=A0A6A5VBU3_9PLEO|nr:hypothetical protein BU23DRAFT_580871 [Bimuria novae-zelandiae CBS 107.79]